jgi:hypothetical protein
MAPPLKLKLHTVLQIQELRTRTFISLKLMNRHSTVVFINLYNACITIMHNFISDATNLVLMLYIDDIFIIMVGELI